MQPVAATAPADDAARGAEHQVTPLELFFDLVFVFAITQVSRLLVSTGYVFRRRTLGAVALLALVPAALAILALAALALVAAVSTFVVAYEAIRHREGRRRLRHPDLAEG